MARKPEVSMPFSKFKNNLAKVLLTEGFIAEMEVKEDGKFKALSLKLKYSANGEPAISGIKRVSKPGQRIYASNSQIPRALGGMGTTIVSTSKGLMTDKHARSTKVGGEVVCQIW